MPSFLKDYSAFYGDHSVNSRGEDLGTFLEGYDPNRYPNPSVTADILVFQHQENFNSVNEGLKLLMVKRKDHPCIGNWALPGGFVNIEEDIELAAKRELKEETNLDGIAIEQIHTWGEHDRDPRTRIVTVAYLALINDDCIDMKAGDDAADATWVSVGLKEVSCEEVIEETIGRSRIKYTYELTLDSEEKNIKLKATVAITENKYGLIKEKEYKVIESNGIAFDHPRFIVQGLLYIKNLLSN